MCAQEKLVTENFALIVKIDEMRCHDDDDVDVDDDDVYETGMDFCLTFRNGYLNKLNETFFFIQLDRFSSKWLVIKIKMLLRS